MLKKQASGSLTILIVFIGATLLIGLPAAAGCWECDSVRDRCESVGAGDDGFEGCYDYTICADGCTTVCDTSGDPCTGQELPTGPEGQGMIVPNGALLPWAKPLDSLGKRRCQPSAPLLG